MNKAVSTQDLVIDVVGEVLHEPIKPLSGKRVIGHTHDLHVLLRHLPPLLGEAFGCSTPLVDLGGRKASNRASHTEVDPSLALSKTAVTTNQTPVLNHHSKTQPHRRGG